MNDCIFCKIISGKIPAYKVYEDDDVLAFLDISQATKGHTILIPKKHVKDIYEMDSISASKVFSSVPLIANALKKAFNPIGLNIINNNEKPLQCIFHYHIHLVPRYLNDGVVISSVDHSKHVEAEDFLDMVEKIKNYL